MREPVVCEEKYLGYPSPLSPEELQFEILGLESLIKKAEQKISRLKQTKYLVEKAHENGFQSLEKFFMDTENEILHLQESKR